MTSRGQQRSKLRDLARRAPASGRVGGASSPGRNSSRRPDDNPDDPWTGFQQYRARGSRSKNQHVPMVVRARTSASTRPAMASPRRSVAWGGRTPTPRDALRERAYLARYGFRHRAAIEFGDRLGLAGGFGSAPRVSSLANRRCAAPRGPRLAPFRTGITSVVSWVVSAGSSDVATAHAWTSWPFRGAVDSVSALAVVLRCGCSCRAFRR